MSSDWACFTDGSLMERKSGAGAVLYNKQNDPWQVENRYQKGGGKHASDLHAFVHDFRKSLSIPEETIRQLYARYEKDPNWMPA